MALVCPPKHTKEWKDYIALVGDKFKATRYWLANKEQIPTKEQLANMNIEIGPREKVKFQPLITNIQQNINALKTKEASLWAERKSAIGQKRLDLEGAISKIQNKLKELALQTKELAKEEALERVAPYAEQQLGEVRDILYNKDKITFHDLTSISRTIALWKKAGVIDEDHLFFDREELEALDRGNNEVMEKIRADFTKWGSQATRMEDKFHERAVELLTAAATEHYGSDANIDFQKVMKDIGVTRAMTIDISEADNTLYQLMSSWIKQSSFETHEEEAPIMEETDKVLEGLVKQGYKLNDVFELFRQVQSNTDNRYTGNATFRFTQEFFNHEKVQGEKLRDLLEYAETIADPEEQRKATSKAISDYYKTRRKEELPFDVRKLFPDKSLYNSKEFSTEEIEDHKKELIKNLGQKGYDFYSKRAKEEIAEYKELYEAEIRNNEQLYPDDLAVQSRNMDMFEKKFSPYYIAESVENGVAPKVAGQYINQNRKYTVVVPRRFVEGKDTGFYDKKFEQIEADDNILGFYNHFMETKHEMDNYLPEHEKEGMQINSIPNIAKTLVEKYTVGGFNQGLSPLLDALKTNLRSGESSTELSDLSSDVNGKTNMTLQANFARSNTSQISDYVNNKATEIGLNGGKVTSAMMLEWKKEAQHKFANDKTYDFGKILKAYTHAALLYKHKSSVEDAMNVANMIMDRAVEQQVNPAGEAIYDQYGDPKTQRGLKHMRDQLEATMKYFYGYKTRKTEAQTKAKAYTREELEKKKQIEDLEEAAYNKYQSGELSQEDFLLTTEKLDSQLEKLGGFYTGGRMADMMLKYIQIKAMGWNIFAGFCNVAFGMPSNYIEASGGQRFNVRELNAAYKLTMATLGGKNTAMGRKIITLMEKYDVLKETRNELEKHTKGMSTMSRLSRKFRWLNPYIVQAKTEYVNQAPIMIAMMLHGKAKDAEGKEVNMFDAYDEEGKLKQGYILTEEEGRFKERMDEAIANVHGNYDPDKVIAGKQYTLFRAMTQFKIWALMGFYDRFGSGKYSHVAGFYKEGRYNAYNHLYSQYGVMQGTFILTKQLMKKIMFQSTNFGQYGDLTETDVANLRKNLTEIIAFTSIMGTALLTKAIMTGNDPDDRERKKKLLAVFPMYAMINSLNRTGSDLAFYTSPMSFQQLQSNIIPAFSFVTDAQNFLYRSSILITGGDDVYHGGRHNRHSKTLQAASKLVPGLVMYDRLKALNYQIWNNNNH